MKYVSCLALFLLISLGPLSAQERGSTSSVPIIPADVAVFPGAISESSGLVESRCNPGLFWTHNDSGNPARIYAVRKNGKLLEPWTEGISIGGFPNIDWEDIAIDDKNRLYVGDIGNNRGRRNDLAILVLPDPSCEDEEKANPYRIPIAYPSNGGSTSYDAEALFVYEEKIYILTKNTIDLTTTLFCLDNWNPARINILRRISTFDIRGLVTAADISPDGRRLAVLTYSRIWIFSAPFEGDDFLSGTARSRALIGGQCEGIAFSGEELLITNEQRMIFTVPLSELP